MNASSANGFNNLGEREEDLNSSSVPFEDSLSVAAGTSSRDNESSLSTRSKTKETS